MCYKLYDIEKKQSIKLPERYKQLYQSNFQDISVRLTVQINEEAFNIKKFITVTEIIHALDEFYDFWGYDIICPDSAVWAARIAMQFLSE